MCDQPQLSALVEGIFHAFFCLRHEQSYRIADKARFHLPRNKRKLYKQFNKNVVRLNVLSRKQRGYTQLNSKERVPGAFSHMSQRGTSLGLARPTLICRLASLLHMCTCGPLPAINKLKFINQKLQKARSFLLSNFERDRCQITVKLSNLRSLQQ